MVLHYDQAIADDLATYFYNELSTTIDWRPGVPSRKTGHTRMACPLEYGDNEIVDTIINTAIELLKQVDVISGIGLVIFGVYLNYYRDGNEYTPMHRHPDSKQIVVSLGATRTLKIDSTDYATKNGDLITFDHELHGVPQEPQVNEGRISVAFFVKVVENSE